MGVAVLVGYCVFRLFLFLHANTRYSLALHGRFSSRDCGMSRGVAPLPAILDFSIRARAIGIGRVHRNIGDHRPRACLWGGNKQSIPKPPLGAGVDTRRGEGGVELV